MSSRFEKLKDLPEFIRRLKRGIMGQPIDDDVFSGLLNIKDTRERTRLNEHDVLGHSAMRIMADNWPVEMGIWDQIADMEDVYFIAKDGEQRKEAILMTRAKVEPQGSPLTVALPAINTKPEEQPKQEKKGFFHR